MNGFRAMGCDVELADEVDATAVRDLFHARDLRLRAYGRVQLQPGPHWLEIPAEDLWIF